VKVTLPACSTEEGVTLNVTDGREYTEKGRAPLVTSNPFESVTTTTIENVPAPIGEHESEADPELVQPAGNPLHA